MVFRKKRYWLLAGLVCIPTIALAWAWNERVPIARSVINDTLKTKGVPARYEIRNMGSTLQRLENVSVGEPSRPDLTADWVEIDTALWLFGYEIRAIRAGGVRLRGKLVDGQVSLGVLDRILPRKSDEPFSLPDMDVALTNSVAEIETSYGPIGIATARATGNPARKFTAQVGVFGPRLAKDAFVATNVRGSAQVLLNNGQAKVSGPISMESFGGGGVVAKVLKGQLDLSTRGNQFTADLPLTLVSGSAQGVDISRLTLSANADGNLEFGSVSFGAKGRADVNKLPGAQAKAARFDLAGKFGNKGLERLSGPIWLDGAAPGRAQLVALQDQLVSFGGTPIEPIFRKLSASIGGLESGSTVEAKLDCWPINGVIGCNVEPSLLASKSGLVVRGQGARLNFGHRSANLIAGRYSVSGGGFPSLAIDITGSLGNLRFKTGGIEFAEGLSRLSFSPLSGKVDGRGLSLNTQVSLSGSLGRGSVEGLAIPVSIRPGREVLAGCTETSLQNLEFDNLRLRPARFKLCRAGNVLNVENMSLAGTLGQNPITLASSGGRVTIPNADFAFRNVAVRLAAEGAPTTLDLDELRGTLGKGGAEGSYSGAAGKLANVPLNVSQGTGRWSFRNGLFQTQAGIMVSDSEPAYRFTPLASPDFVVRLFNGKIDARGSLVHPGSGRLISTVAITHDLGRGTGQADLNVSGLDFDDRFQPEQLTPLTLGVVANVRGRVTGNGAIRWTPQGVQSTGKFRTEKTDLAAAFGPVENLSAEISLSDLLGLEASDIQTVSLGSVNPGIAVIDGEVQYRLLPNRRIEIIGGKWPFAGGFLVLEPTIMDMAQDVERNLTFRVEGIDIARFIAAMQFDNIAATGLFDGKLPMVFDANGGRIDNGQLVARSGGTLSYIGQISNESMSPMAQFAFDALRSLKYDRLSVDMDGAIDGDVITRIKFAGVNKQPLGVKRASLPIPVKITGLDNIPFIFNVTITAKFRQLFEMAKSFNDPSILINRLVPQLEPADIEKLRRSGTVQPSDSATKP